MSTVMIWQTVSTSSDDTEQLGRQLGKLLKKSEIIELRSDLGGGKTTFVKGLVAGLDSKDVVASPTFTLNKIYKAEDVEIHHYDFYRLNEPGIMRDELAESLQNPNIITVVEWPDIVQKVLPKDRLTIEFKPTANDADEREIIITYPASRSGLIRKLETDWVVIKP